MYVLYQANEGITKLVTLMVEGYLNKIMKYKCNTCIVM